MKNILLLGSLIVLPLVFFSPVSAAPISWAFSGTVLLATGIWSGGDATVTGSFTYDSDLIEVEPHLSDPSQDLFEASTLANQMLYWDITITLGKVTRSSSNNSNPVGQRHHFLNIVDRPDSDRFRIDGNSGSNEDLFRIMLRDESPSPPDFISAGTGNLSGRPPISAPQLALAQTCAFIDLGCYSGTNSFSPSGQPIGSLIFEVNSLSISTSSVPLPPSWPLMAAGLCFLLRRKSNAVEPPKPLKQEIGRR